MPPKAQPKNPRNRYYHSVFGLTLVSYVKIELSAKATNTYMLLTSFILGAETCLIHLCLSILSGHNILHTQQCLMKKRRIQHNP